MAQRFTIGHSKRGKETAVINGFEFWKLRESSKGETTWRCLKYDALKCRARLRTAGEHVLYHSEHNHEATVATAYVRQAIHDMKQKMNETTATPASARCAVSRNLSDQVGITLNQNYILHQTVN